MKYKLTRLLLRPYNFSIIVFGTILGDLIESKWSNLLKANDCHIFTSELFTFPEQFIENLSSAKHKCLQNRKQLRD